MTRTAKTKPAPRRAQRPRATTGRPPSPLVRPKSLPESESPRMQLRSLHLEPSPGGHEERAEERSIDRGRHPEADEEGEEADRVAARNDRQDEEVVRQPRGQEGEKLGAQVVLEDALAGPQLADAIAHQALGERMQPEILRRRKVLEQADEEAEGGARHRAL